MRVQTGGPAKANLIDELAPERVLVFGSSPDAGRDLDLLVRPHAEAAISAAMAERGAVRLGRAWLLPETGEVIDLVPASEWRLAEEELARLLDVATPLPGHTRLAAPAPEDELLILARRAIYERRPSSSITERAAKLVADRKALEGARSSASAWGASLALECVEALARDGRIGPAARARAVFARERSDGAGRIRALIAGIRLLLPAPPRRGVLVALSGLDGSGKSSQAAALAELAESLGVRTTMIWSSVSQHPLWLHRLADLIRRAIPVGRRESSSSDDDERKRRGAELRRRSGLLTTVWSGLVTVQLALALARRSWPTVLRGGVVVCDRYMLDTAVQLRFHYGERRGYRPQLAFLSALTPRSDLSYFLDVAPEVATARKADFDVADNTQRARLYRGSAAEAGVTRLDGTATQGEILAKMATDLHALLIERGLVAP